MQRPKFDPHNGYKILGEEENPCNYSTEEVQKRIPETQWPVSRQSGEFKIDESLYLKGSG